MEYEVVLLEPAIGFIVRLQPKFRAKALRTIDLLAEFGGHLSMPHCRKLSGYDMWELRVRFASDICRLFYFFHQERVYIVTSGYIKKSNHTSVTEIQRAVKLKNQFISEKEK